MSLDAPSLTVATMNAMRREMKDGLNRIDHCLAQLSDDELWWRPQDRMNSVANLLLHVCGNLRQWIIAGVGGAEDLRIRQSEFDEQGPISRAELHARLVETLDECEIVLGLVTPEELVKERRIQGFPVTGIEAIVHSVNHLQGHVQEIVHMTRILRGTDYHFAFVPTTPEQGA